MKRIVVVSDLHCGHPKGLVPPTWQTEKFQTDFWKWYKKILDALQPIHILVCNGDAIDGNGRINSGVELITSDRLVQVEMAKQALSLARAEKVVLTTGSPYHVGKEEDFERVLAENMNACDFQDKLILNVNGVIFNIRHHHSRSIMPYGKATALLRSALWGVLGSQMTGADKQDVLIRSHVHYHAYCGDPLLGLALTTPGLQLDSRFGSRLCEGIINVGLVYFDVENKGSFSWKTILRPAKLAAISPLVL